MNGIETNCENNYFIVRNNSSCDVIDPFNGIYTTINNYNIKGVESIIIPDAKSIIKPECNQNNVKTSHRKYIC